MRKMSKKIIVSVLTLVLTVVALGTTTYAWFTVGGTVAVEDFDMQVTSGVGLEIAYLHKEGSLTVDDPNVLYTKKIDADSLYAYLYVDYYGFLGADATLADVRANIPNYVSAWAATFTMDAFTSTDGVSLNRIPENLPEDIDLIASGIQIDDPDNLGTKIDYDYELHGGLIGADKTDGFIEFTLAFRTKEVVGTSLFLNEVTYNSAGVQWRPEVPFTMVGGSQFLPTDSNQTFRAVNGARISLTDESGLVAPIVIEKATSGNVNTQLSNNTPNWAQGAHSYYKGVTLVDLQDYYGAYEAAETQTGIVGTGGQQEVAKFAALGTPTQYNYATVTIRIYLEGFDSETFNAIFEDVIKARFGFNIDIE